jgi:hypothetical protein
MLCTCDVLSLLEQVVGLISVPPFPNFDSLVVAARIAACVLPPFIAEVRGWLGWMCLSIGLVERALLSLLQAGWAGVLGSTRLMLTLSTAVKPHG